MSSNISNTSYPLAITNSKYYLILFILWPFLALITAIANYSQKEGRKVIYIFLIYFGLSFVIKDEGYVDAAGYAMQFKNNALLPLSDFFKIVGGIYATGTSVDFIEPFISFIVSRFTDDPRFLFGAYASLFGFFYLKSISLLHNHYRENPGWDGFIHMAFFTVILPITAINGVRMWTAAWIFFYGAYHVILHRDARYFLITLASALMHFSFLSANVILLIYFLAGNRNLIYFPLAIASFIVPHFITPLLQSISLYLGGGLQRRFDSYTNLDYVSLRQGDFETASWFLKIGNDLVLYYLMAVMIVIQFKSGCLMKGKAERNLFSFLLLFLAFVNFTKGIPSFGARFQIVFFLFATLYVFLYFIKLHGNKINLLTLLGIFPMILYVVVTFRQASPMINAWIFTPGVGLPLFAPSLSVADLLFN